ncbi:RING-H2 finger protein ATL16-like [Zingiber officinale]|uniref:RING-type E3 ubiquitin transferase n=1 Tax=Zingiber officinale TaxID=94328 RepID=A0A8J5CUE5_ZINOF|nr:RING-H2 finger protein ATL16-like [Zingiber officinale]KAG6469956.1 hypothetical protein ZIOFF_070892 [Zingiber officinale]
MTSPFSSVAGFPVVAVSIVGILATSLLLLGYYVFVTKCGLNGQEGARRHGGSAAGGQLGLDESTIRAIPTLRYRQFLAGPGECAVCLSGFREQERIRLLPACLHVFHIDCVDTWLQSNANCPLCRASVTAPAPVEPLAAAAMARRFGRETGGEAGEQRKAAELFASRGDEWIGAGKKDEALRAQPMRRSLSMDSSTDARLHVALRQGSRAENDGAGGGILRRSLFLFGRSSCGSVLPL